MTANLNHAPVEVLRVNGAEEKADFLSAVHQVISAILAEKQGRTLIDIAEAIDCTVQTISAAFNRRHALSATYLTRLGKVYGPHCLDPVARLSGARMVPLEADDGADALPPITGAVHRLAVARSPGSPGGDRITHTELLEIEPDIDAAIRALTSLKIRCERVRAA